MHHPLHHHRPTSTAVLCILLVMMSSDRIMRCTDSYLVIHTSRSRSRSQLLQYQHIIQQRTHALHHPDPLHISTPSNSCCNMGVTSTITTPPPSSWRKAIFKPFWRMLIGSLIGFRAVPFLPSFTQSAIASASVISVGGGPSSTVKSPLTPAQGLLLWFFLSVLTALMHSTESAITKISPWKVKQFADEEGPSSPFATLSSDITRLLITILLFTTACSIYKTALFVSTVEKMFPTASLGAITAGR